MKSLPVSIGSLHYSTTIFVSLQTIFFIVDEPVKVTEFESSWLLWFLQLIPITFMF